MMVKQIQNFKKLSHKETIELLKLYIAKSIAKSITQCILFSFWGMFAQTKANRLKSKSDKNQPN